MYKRILVIIFLFLPIVSFAQKKQLSEAKSYLKSGNNLDKAESLVREVIAMPGESGEIDHYVLLADIVRKQYEASNEKLYLKQLSDTASMFPALRKLFLTYELLDSVDALPDKNGKVKTKLRRKNAEYLDHFRPNLFNGGIYSMQRKNYSEAYECMDVYLGTYTHPLFSHCSYSDSDSLRYQAAYWAVLAAHWLKDHAGVQKHEELAQRYAPRAPHLLALLYEDYKSHGDMAGAISYLKKGFNKYSDFPFFFPRLVDYYSSQNQLDTVKHIVDKAIEMEPGNQFYRIAQNNLQLNMGDYDACIALGDSLIHTNDKIAEAYFNVGSSYFNKAIERDQRNDALKQRRKEVNELYAKAMPYLERYRSLRRKAVRRWAPMLYSIYLNLNKGQEFDEIDRLLKSVENSKVSKKR